MKTYCTRGNERRFILSVMAGALILFGSLLSASLLQAEPAVSARYIQSNGREVVIEITVGSPPPASIILIQRFSRGTKMLASNPGANTYNAKKNMAKWLLRNLRPGKFTVRMTLDNPIADSDISGEIRFKPTLGEKMIQSTVAQ